jgi:class 3 adenylate cyclase
MQSEASEQRKLAAIMFTDMVGYSTLSQRDDKLALELLEEHRQLLRGIFPASTAPRSKHR